MSVQIPLGGGGDINTKHHLVPIYLITDIYCLGFQKIMKPYSWSVIA